jgi:hypothetical protein
MLRIMRLADAETEIDERGENAMKINCLSCGFKVDLDDDAYADYEGQAKCCTCGRLLQIWTIDGKLKSVQLADCNQTPLCDKTTGHAGTAAH